MDPRTEWITLAKEEKIRLLERFLTSALGKALSERRMQAVNDARATALGPCASIDECLVGEFAKGVAEGREFDPAAALLSELKIDEES